jgi:hypothetical protein
MKSSINFPINLNLKYISIHNINYFVLADLHYYKLPLSFFFTMTDTSIEFFCNNLNLKKEFTKFIITFSKWLKKFNKTYVRKVLLKGLGLKVNLSSDFKILEFKLGFSHIIKVKIPLDKLNVKIIKNIISVTGFNLVTVGNFLYKIRALKSPNTYKGKGIWYKNEVRTLKAIKKT